MAELYFKLGQLDNAERILVTELENGKVDYMDIRLLTSRTKLLQLLAKVRRKQNFALFYIHNPLFKFLF